MASISMRQCRWTLAMCPSSVMSSVMPASPEDSGCTPDSGCFFYGLYIAVREGYANVVMENAHLIQRIAKAEEKVVKLTKKVKKLKKKVVKHAEKKRARKAKQGVKKMVKVIKRKLRSGREF